MLATLSWGTASLGAWKWRFPDWTIPLAFWRCDSWSGAADLDHASNLATHSLTVSFFVVCVGWRPTVPLSFVFVCRLSVGQLTAGFHCLVLLRWGAWQSRVWRTSWLPLSCLRHRRFTERSRRPPWASVALSCHCCLLHLCTEHRPWHLVTGNWRNVDRCSILFYYFRGIVKCLLLCVSGVYLSSCKVHTLDQDWNRYVLAQITTHKTVFGAQTDLIIMWEASRHTGWQNTTTVWVPKFGKSVYSTFRLGPQRSKFMSENYPRRVEVPNHQHFPNFKSWIWLFSAKMFFSFWAISGSCFGTIT